MVYQWKTVYFSFLLSCPPLQDGVTALLMASQEGHEEVVRLLLQSGAQDFRAKVG